MIEIIRPGAQASVQDLGRVGFRRFGVGRSGAADSLALQVGNRLLGNTPVPPASNSRWAVPPCASMPICAWRWSGPSAAPPERRAGLVRGMPSMCIAARP